MNDPRTMNLSRRRLLTLAGVSAAAVAVPVWPKSAAAVTASPTAVDAATCAADTDEQEVGPFYVAEGIVRSDVTAGEAGIPLTWTMTITDSDTCKPLVGAAVDIWSANALGVYSDESSEDTVGDTYLRGVQISDASGQVTFSSVWPGWYAGRTNHVHLRVYTGGAVSGTAYSYTGATLIYTGQLFLDPTLNTSIAAIAPYSSNTTARTLNSTDRVYSQQDGSTRLMPVTGSVKDGYVGTTSLSVSPTASSTGTGGTALTLNASETSLKAGKKLTLSGVLGATATATGLADQDVTLTMKLHNGTTYSKVIETDSGGAWTHTLDATTTATYTATYAGNTTYAAATSTSVKVTVDYRLSLSDISGTAAASKAVEASGRVVPARKDVVVTIHRVSSSGKRYTAATTKTNSKGHWSTHWHLSKGSHTIVATVPTDHDDHAAASRTVTVHRT